MPCHVMYSLRGSSMNGHLNNHSSASQMICLIFGSSKKFKSAVLEFGQLHSPIFYMGAIKKEIYKVW